MRNINSYLMFCKFSCKSNDIMEENIVNKEVISDKQGILIIIMFILGTSSIFVTGLEAQNDIWLAVILSILAALPIILIYARLHYIFQGEDLFSIIEICFGKFIGKVIGIIYVWFIFHTGTSVLMNWTQFVITVTFPETPIVIVTIIAIILSIWIVKEGIEVIGRWVSLFLLFVICIIISGIILSIPNMDIDNVQPLLYNGIKPVLKGAYSVFMFPFTQLVVITMSISNFRRKRSSFKIYILGLFIGGVLILLTSLSNILVLGVDIASNTYYPSYDSATKINIGNLLQRMEILVAIGFTLTAFLKISIYLLATCKGITKVFGYTDYRFIVTPIALLMINLSIFLNDSLMDYFSYITEVWIYYAFPFHVILPIIIWIVAEIRKKKLKV